MAKRRAARAQAQPGQIAGHHAAPCGRPAGEGDTLGWGLLLLAGLAVAGASAMAFFYAPREATMGDVQRIFYGHVASAWVGFLGFGVACGAGIAYLARRARRWDALAIASVEIGLACMVMAVATGMLWARPVWGVFWTWEPRLTITALQLLLYVACLMLRASLDDPELRARYAAVYTIVAFATVPLSWFAIRWWRTIHPDLLTGDGGMAITTAMLQTLGVSVAASTLLYVALVRQRVRLEALRHEVERLRGAAEEAAAYEAAASGEPRAR